MERGVCAGGAASRAAHLPGRLGRGPAGGNHQGAWHPHQGADSRNEPQLY